MVGSDTRSGGLTHGGRRAPRSAPTPEALAPGRRPRDGRAPHEPHRGKRAVPHAVPLSRGRHCSCNIARGGELGATRRKRPEARRGSQIRSWGTCPAASTSSSSLGRSQPHSGRWVRGWRWASSPVSSRAGSPACRPGEPRFGVKTPDEDAPLYPERIGSLNRAMMNAVAGYRTEPSRWVGKTRRPGRDAAPTLEVIEKKCVCAVALAPLPGSRRQRKGSSVPRARAASSSYPSSVSSQGLRYLPVDREAVRSVGAVRVPHLLQALRLVEHGHVRLPAVLL